MNTSLEPANFLQQTVVRIFCKPSNRAKNQSHNFVLKSCFRQNNMLFTQIKTISYCTG